jgi:xanthine dehydrogenase YagR molybdenum-binding subunit
MSIAAPEPKANMGQPVPRYDAVAKVTSKAAYAAGVALNKPAFAYLVTSSIAKGRIDGFDLAAAKQVRGVIDIVTHENTEKLQDAKLQQWWLYFLDDPAAEVGGDCTGRPDRRGRVGGNV